MVQIALTPYVALIALVGVIAAAGSGFLAGWSWRADRCEVQVAGIEGTRKTKVIAAQQKVIDAVTVTQKINQEVSDDNQQKLAAIKRRHDDALVRVLNSRAGSNCLPTVSSATSGTDAPPSANGLSGRSDAALVDLAAAADINTQQLLSCQEWIRRQQAAAKNNQ